MAKALLVIDIQNDFCEGGALPVSGGAAVATKVSKYMAESRPMGGRDRDQAIHRNQSRMVVKRIRHA